MTKPQTTLTAAINRHLDSELVSLHTPGHKGRPSKPGYNSAIDALHHWDLTELPGLDDLSAPTGVLLDLEARAEAIWGAQSSLLSVNGASACLIAAIMTLSRRGSQILVARNCHRSVINALILSGLEPIWFEPIWEESWGLWGPATAKNLSVILKDKGNDNMAGVVVVSPTYAGAITDIKDIAAICHRHNLPLLVDEAHGAHLIANNTKANCALNSGADLVVHSLHKTLPCLTQTGILHLSKNGASQFGLNKEDLRASLNLVQSTSPSYIFLSSIDELISSLEDESGLQKLEEIERLGESLRKSIGTLKTIHLYQPDCGALNTHILIKCPNSEKLAEFLRKRGIFSECLLGSGLLLLLGVGSSERDGDLLVKALEEFEQSANGASGSKNNTQPIDRPGQIEQVLPPRRAFFMPSQSVPALEAVGQIASTCLAPCPPGWPVILPGQRIDESSLHQHKFQSIKVVIQSR